jgi:hypothetical protein
MLDLTTRENLIASLPKDAIVAEIGVDYGYFSERISQLCKPKLFFLIDCWENQNTDVYGNDPANNTNEFKNGQYDIVMAKFGYKYESNVLKAYSIPASKMFKDNFFDWVYIDANHLQAKQDIEAWLPKVKKGGYILGHDYTMVGDYITVKRDVDEYVAEHSIELFVTTGEGGDVYEKNYPTWIFQK